MIKLSVLFSNFLSSSTAKSPLLRFPLSVRCWPFIALDFQFFQSGFLLFISILLISLHTVHLCHQASFPDDLSLISSCVLLQTVTLILNYISLTHQTPSSFISFHIQSVHVRSWVHSFVDGNSFVCTPVILLSSIPLFMHQIWTVKQPMYWWHWTV